ncbi:MAG: N-acetyltransferase [Lachnospiraceae bacterium]|jgi:diamine N-acetyltransferase|nr:N-acetyltransferase [Lachnospiraceae bacterium]
MIELRKVDDKNIWKIIKLSVNADQENFVATNTQSILQAYTTITSGGIALPFGMYEDDCLVGFVMFAYGTNGEDDLPKVADNSYCIWRFMIDQEYQNKGIGRKALIAAIDYIKTMPCGEADYCWLSYEPENEVAKKLYTWGGFEETGEICGDEIVSVLKLR